MSSTYVQTGYGQVKGEQMNGVSVWKGIPYAKAARFHPPQRPDAWEGVYEAVRFGPAAMQPESEVMSFLGASIKEGEMSEDCHTVNIWSPAADGAKRPVMVWIHGGAFLNGAGSSPAYDGTTFAKEHDVVIVTFNYRLGVFGFLHAGSIDQERYTGSANCGLLDQIAALEWVKENIEGFGGDPENITVFGESAGAMSIGVLLTLPAAKPLFQKAILQSGASRNVLSPAIAEQVCRGVLAHLEISAEDIAKLEEVSAEELLAAAKNIPPMMLGPTLDGVVIQELPEASLAKGVCRGIPILIGTNKDEYNLYSAFDSTLDQLDDEGVALRLQHMLQDKWAQITPQLQGRTFDKGLFEQVMTFDIFTAPAIHLAQEQAKQEAPVWMYRFDWESPVLDGALKSCHALEIPFVWNALERGAGFLLGSTPDKALADRMQKAWVAFAREGDPNIEELPTWPAYHTKNRETMIFDKDCRTITDPNQELRLIWEATALSTQ